ncbi:MAG: signal peptide peptidase SppA [Candidatus Methanolliviera hydrocarbonicum]|uniref:Signal peptide peptidase SppA n=1 Tax=Candidatus Methanolliviera hydrocarbonicum TaxID=2491085 RepID=A0A520KUV9_9EURY|nr:MAG: signal peptide peptidase SppA [Candidatus Methanolliviera hydrocarbonicum]
MKIIKRESMRRSSYLIIGIVLGILMGGIVGYLYFESVPSPFEEKVGVIYVEGTMIAGRGDGKEYVGSEDIISQINRALDDNSIKAIVLRINSPGGTPAGAQEIVGKIKEAKEEKPIVVSMGDTAASGAYYISAPSDYIFAEPDTITGSIGVISKFVDKSKKYEKEGIDITVVKSGEFKDMGADWRALSEEEREYVEKIVEDACERFIKEISDDRGIPLDDVRELSDGRIYRGEEAKELGLVDKMGNMEDAIKKAGELGRIEGKPGIKYMNPPISKTTIEVIPREKLMAVI